jgi:isopenicillin-N epimerase
MMPPQSSTTGALTAYASAVPPSEFPLDPGVVPLNHASFGVPTTALMAHAEHVRHQIERDAARYLAGPLTDELREQAAAIESFIGARPGELALVANSTEASSAVAMSLARDHGLRVVLLDTEYSSVIRAWQIATAPAGGTVEFVSLGLPAASADDVITAFDAEVPGSFDILVVSLIASSTALTLPVRRLAEWARTRGAITVVDAAHGAGHVDLRVEELGAALVFGTLHKWLPVPRPVGFLWVSDELRAVVRPAAVGLRWDDALLERFSWRGTWDPAPALCLTAALAQWQQWQGAGAHARAAQLADRAAYELTTVGLIPAGAPELLAPRLRAFLVPGRDADDLDAALDNSAVRAWVGRAADGRTLLRIATHVYTTDEHVDRLIDALAT